jgi:hypothetical protein
MALVRSQVPEVHQVGKARRISHVKARSLECAERAVGFEVDGRDPVGRSQARSRCRKGEEFLQAHVRRAKMILEEAKVIATRFP